jgi:hypothetical protein
VGVPVNCTVSATSVSSNSSSPVPIVNVTVNWGDGTGEQPLGPITGPTVVSHIYANPGSYQLTAAATDANSQRGTAITSLNVIRVLPTIQITGPTTGTAGTAVSFTVTPPTNPSIPTTNVTVDFGDGTSRNLGAITASQSVVKVYNSPGFYTVAATITDQTNQHNTATTGIQITAGTGPTVTFTHDTAPANANVAEVFTVNAFSGTNGISNVSVRLQDGTLVYSGPPGSFTWTPTNAHIGTQTMTAVATDGAGNTSTRILQITINP